jgi:hypothetical protein
MDQRIHVAGATPRKVLLTSVVNCTQLAASQKKQLNSKQQEGSIRTTAKNFENCVHPPIIKGPDDLVVLDAICPGELHILLGVAKQICEEILVAWPPLEVESADSQGISIDLPDDNESRLGAMA